MRGSLEFRLQAAPRYAEINVDEGLCLASTESKATTGITTVAQGTRLSVAFANQTFAWCVLPNHYHALVEATDMTFGLSTGTASRPHFARLERRRTDSRAENFLPCCRARNAFGSTLLGDVELCSSYPVRHRYVERWTDWPWSSAAEYLARSGKSEVKRLWREYPLHDYGRDWDDPEM